MRYREFKIAESIALYELSDKIKKLVRDKFKQADPNLNDQQIDFYLDRWDRYAASFPVGERDITRLTFNQVEQLIDAAEARSLLRGKSTKKTPPVDTNDDTVYNQNKLTITRGDMRDKCIRYGDGYSWCISRADASNLFYSYRFDNDEPVFYFVFDKDRPKDDPWHAVVIYVTNDNRYKVATALNTGDVEMTWEQISANQPKVSQLQSLFKPQPLSTAERADYAKYGNRVDNDTYAAWPLDGKHKYIQFGNKLTAEQQSATPKELIGIASKLQPLIVTKETWDRLNPSDRKKVEQGQITGVTNNGLGISRIIKAGIVPSEEVQLAAVTNNTSAIDFIVEAGIVPSEAVQLAAASSTHAIGLIIKAGIVPSEAVQLAAVTKRLDVSVLINAGIVPSEAVQLAAVTRQPIAIGAIIEKAGIVPSEEVQLAAVTNDERAISIIAGVKIAGRNERIIPSEAVQIAAAKYDANSIIIMVRNTNVIPTDRALLATVISLGKKMYGVMPFTYLLRDNTIKISDDLLITAAEQNIFALCQLQADKVNLSADIQKQLLYSESKFNDWTFENLLDKVKNPIPALTKKLDRITAYNSSKLG